MENLFDHFVTVKEARTAEEEFKKGQCEDISVKSDSAEPPDFDKLFFREESTVSNVKKKGSPENTSVKSDSVEPPDLAKLLFNEESTISNVKKKRSPENTSVKSDSVEPPGLAKPSFDEDPEISNAKKTPRSHVISHDQRSIPHGVEIIDLESVSDESAYRRSAPQLDLIKLEPEDIVLLGEHQIKRENSIQPFKDWINISKVIEIPDSDDELDQPVSLQAKSNLTLPSETGLDNLDGESPDTTVQTPPLGEINFNAQMDLSTEKISRLQRAYAEGFIHRTSPDGIESVLDPIDPENGDSLLADVEDEYARMSQTLDIERDAVATEFDDNKQNSDEELFISSVSEPLRKRTRQEMTDNHSAGNLEALSSIKKRRIDQEKENEEMACMKADIEDFLMTAEQESRKAKESKRKQGRRKARGKKLHGNRIRTRKSVKKSRGSETKPSSEKSNSSRGLGDLNDIGSLRDADVFGDSNANLGRPELPVLPHKDKSKLLTAILAGIPLEDKRQSRGQRAQLIEATKILGNTSPDGQGNWKMKGMITSLYHYQVLGAALMRQWEDREDGPRGGLQADQMGLGKTIMMLATMVANRPSTNDPKPTLLVCTPALLTQWRREIDRHVEESVFSNILQFKSSSFEYLWVSGNKSALENTDLILATYQEVAKSYPRYKPPDDIETPEEKQDWWDNALETRRGLLHRIHFFRVVLDEAHAIKNHLSHTSIACQALMGKCRWAISGTPIQNEISELYPYFKFLRVEQIDTMRAFTKEFGKEKLKKEGARLHELLNQIMIRRTHKNQIFGSPIIRLPKNTQETVKIDFSAVEMRVYEIIRIRFIRAINVYARKGILHEHMSIITMMFLYLRQLTGHLISAQEVIERSIEPEDLQELSRLVSNGNSKAKTQSRDMLWLTEKIISENNTSTANTSDHIVGTSPPSSSILSDEIQVNEKRDATPLVLRFGKILRKLAKNSNYTELMDRSSCGRCAKPPNDPWVTDCMHVYCKECLDTLAYETARNEGEKTDCQRCRRPFSESRPCGGLKELEKWSNLTKEEAIRRKREDCVEWVNQGGRILHSTKTAAVQAQIEQWLTSDPLKKIIVFCQFHRLMRVLGKACVQKGWKYCDFHGKMTLEARNQAVIQFSQDLEIKIMIASLNCGGVGLNLTMASRIICVDLWWNKCMEQQALCRIHRIGQTSETFVTRFIVKNTVDEKIENLQREKALAIAEVIDNPNVKEKVSLPELMGLFGRVVDDADGKPFIVAEDESENDSATSGD